MKYLSRGVLDRELHSSEGINVMVMGPAKVGKTSVIKGLLKQLEKNDDNQTKNIYEYRDGSTTGALDEKSPPSTPVSTAYRRRAIRLGEIFVLVFAVDNHSAFDYVEKLKDEICAMKGNDVPLIFVGNKSDLRKKRSKQDKMDTNEHVSYAFADLMVSVEWEKTYEEVSATNNAGFERLLNSIEKEQLVRQC